MKQYLKLIRCVAQRTKSKNKMIELIFFTKVQTMSLSGENSWTIKLIFIYFFFWSHKKWSP